MSSVPLKDWEKLYNTFIEFKRSKSWNWMSDKDIFGVQNPTNGEIGYCCILGKLGEVFGLVVYIGTEGLRGYLKIKEGVLRGADALHLNKCLIASFEDRKFLQKEDFQIIKKLGLSFKGQASWPLFRSYRPGYHPWFLTRGEVKYLTLALQQALDVALRFKKNRKMLIPPKENYYLVRVPKRCGGELIWRDEWLKPRKPKEKESPSPPIDELRLKRIKKNIIQTKQVWEIDFFYSPTPVRERGRPYYPYVFLWVNHHSGIILNLYTSPHSGYEEGFLNQFLHFFERVNTRPHKILVKKERIFTLLEPLTARLEIELVLADKLNGVEEAQISMFEFFR
jgi:hypothetical protein